MLTRPSSWLGRAWPYCLNHWPWNLKGSPQRSTTWSSVVWPGLDTGWSSSVQGAHCSQDSHPCNISTHDPVIPESRKGPGNGRHAFCPHLIGQNPVMWPHPLQGRLSHGGWWVRETGLGKRCCYISTTLFHLHINTARAAALMLTQGNSVNCPRFALLLDGASKLKSVFRPPKLQFLCFTKL